MRYSYQTKTKEASFRVVNAPAGRRLARTRTNAGSRLGTISWRKYVGAGATELHTALLRYRQNSITSSLALIEF